MKKVTQLDQLGSADMAAQYSRPYQRIAADLRRKIRAGRWRAGDRLPTEAQLVEEYEAEHAQRGKRLSRNTIRGATNLLAEWGYVEKRPGSGIYVREQEPDPVSYTSDEPIKPDVAAAVVTSHLGVLVGERRDRRPQWSFISGKAHQGETVSDAAVREVKEETGLDVVAGRALIGRRIHPRTGWDMHYVACTPVGGLGVHIGDPDELTDVRWVPTLLELLELFGGRGEMYAPVVEHLERILR